MLEWFKKHQPTMAAVAAVAAAVAAIASATGAWVSAERAQEAQAAAEARAYLTLRDRFYSVWLELPDGYSNLEMSRDSDQWRLFKRYWYVSFDEWYVTRNVGAFEGLWEKYYKGAFLDALEKPSMRKAICLLREKEFREGARQEFVVQLESIFREAYPGRAMCN